MGCASCGEDDEKPGGCGSNGNCQTGGCNKLNAFDWISKRDIPTIGSDTLVEVSFKNGARKDFFHLNTSNIPAITGDMIVVDTGSGYDVGEVSLSGALVNLQIKKKKHSLDRITQKVIRLANERDLEKLKEARSKELDSMRRARVIARNLGLNMKVGDVEYQGDLRKATFFYTAEGRVDFRELVRAYAREFRVKIEMRQIGSRQESARIGGIGSCGRELCCSTWLTDFKSVSTSAARYQYMAINQSKLSGQCGRLKCCLNYELDNYMDAISHFPKKADFLKTKYARAKLMKIDIFKGIMYYGISTDKGRGPIVALDKEDVKKVLEMNRNGEYPEDLMSFVTPTKPEDDFQDYADVTGAVELPERKRKKKRNNRKKPGHSPKRPDGGKPGQGQKPNSRKPKSQKPKENSNNNPKAKDSNNPQPKSKSTNKTNNRNSNRRKKTNSKKQGSTPPNKNNK